LDLLTQALELEKGGLRALPGVVILTLDSWEGPARISAGFTSPQALANACKVGGGPAVRVPLDGGGHVTSDAPQVVPSPPPPRVPMRPIGHRPASWRSRHGSGPQSLRFDTDGGAGPDPQAPPPHPHSTAGHRLRLSRGFVCFFVSLFRTFGPLDSRDCDQKSPPFNPTRTVRRSKGIPEFTGPHPRRLTCVDVPGLCSGEVYGVSLCIQGGWRFRLEN